MVVDHFICFSSKTKKAEDGLRCVLSEGNTHFRPRWYDCRALSSFRPLAYGDSSLRALPALSNKEFRLGPGKRWQQQKGRGPCSCCARPLSSRFGIYYKRENPLQITTSLLGSVWNGRERTKWIYNPSREWSYVNSRLMENNFHVRFREHFFR